MLDIQLNLNDFIVDKFSFTIPHLATVIEADLEFLGDTATNFSIFLQLTHSTCVWFIGVSTLCVTRLYCTANTAVFLAFIFHVFSSFQ